MRAWRREVAELIAGEVGDAPVVWLDDDAAAAPSAVAVLVLSWVGRAPTEPACSAALARAEASLAAEGTLVVVDHNRPRRLAAALTAVLRSPGVPGATPATRWRRLAHPTARAVQAAGFRVERLRLAAGERVQVVFARR
jgi:hypothetical protein